MIEQIHTLSTGFERFLAALDLSALARACGFFRRKPRKLSFSALLHALLGLASSGGAKVSLRQLAIHIGLSISATYSKQALAKRLHGKIGAFMTLVLGECMRERLRASRRAVLPGFDRVLMVDSTVIKLHPKHAAMFAGASNGSGKPQSALKIQLAYDLLSEALVELSLSGFRRNDQAASGDILAYARKGDLVLRDLGYFVTDVFARMLAGGIDFISRLDPQVNVFDACTGERIDLLKTLRRHRNMDTEVMIAEKQRVRVRLVATPVPDAVANQRRRKARANRDKRCKPDRRRLALMGWQIMITSVNTERLSAAAIFKTYRLRWRIETLFKAYKQHFELAKLHTCSAGVLVGIVYAKLILITGMHHMLSACIHEDPAKAFSLIKLAEMLQTLLHGLFRCPASPEALIEQIRYHARYDRRSRTNFIQHAQQARC